MASTTSYLQGAHNLRIDNLSITHSSQHAGRSVLEYLQDHIASGAIHNSGERCNAPTCWPETRAAVQGDIMSWIGHGEQDPEPMMLMWLSGPAGSGKSAIAGSVTEACQERDFLAASFFFSSFSPSPERSLKKYLVPTLAYQLLQHDALEGMEEHVSRAIQRDPVIFKKRLKAQFEALILKPLRKLQPQLSQSTHLPKIFVIDGVDEVKAEQIGGATPHTDPLRDEDDHLEVLSCLLHASKDPAFPFRILIVSRPERVFTDFFSTRAHDRSKQLFLDKKYDPDSDIRLYLTAKFAELRRRYRLPPSWPTQDAIEALVRGASGQFIYAATVVRFIESGRLPPHSLLDRVLNLRYDDCGHNPFAPLDALYTHVLMSSPNPPLAVQWLGVIKFYLYRSPGRFVSQLLSNFDGQASYLMEHLASLVRMPPPDTEDTHLYEIYHKSVIDFLQSKRCGEELWNGFSRADVLFRSRYSGVIINKAPVVPLPKAELRVFLSEFLSVTWVAPQIWQKVLHWDIAWWISTLSDMLPISSHLVGVGNVIVVTWFLMVHNEQCLQTPQQTFSGCHNDCIRWRSRIFQACRTQGWGVPGVDHLLNEASMPPTSDPRRMFERCFHIPPQTPCDTVSKNRPASYEDLYTQALDLYQNSLEGQNLTRKGCTPASVEPCSEQE